LKDADLEVISRARDGSPTDFEKLINHYTRYAYKIAYGILLNRADAEEVVQEAFLTVYQRLAGLKNSEAFPSWLAKIITNLCFKQAQKNRPHISLENLSADESKLPAARPDTEPETALLNEEKDALIRRAVRELPLGYRAALVLREFEGYSYTEIAAIMDIPPGTVKSRLHKARALLAEKLGPEREVYDDAL